jgi:hypothetical protein
MSHRLAESVANPGNYIAIIYCDCCGNVVNHCFLGFLPKESDWEPVYCTKCQREYEGLEHYDGRYDHLKIIVKPITICIEDVVEN